MEKFEVDWTDQVAPPAVLVLIEAEAIWNVPAERRGWLVTRLKQRFDDWLQMSIGRLARRRFGSDLGLHARWISHCLMCAMGGKWTLVTHDIVHFCHELP